MSCQVVMDTNVFISALRSRQGASFLLLSWVDRKRFSLNLSVPLVLEYEEAAKRMAPDIGLTAKDVDAVLEYLCRIARLRQIYFLWRPYLKDPRDDHVLELAVEAACDFIITCNTRDFVGVERFGLRALTPKEFLQRIGVLP